jgi:iron complex transport system substrate-binding protein
MMKSISIALTMLLASQFVLADEIKRIVSADGSLTEIVYALGQEDKLVGVDTTSGFPVSARSLPQIGYKRNISAEGVLSLEPQVLIATQDSGPDKVLDQIEGAGVEVFKYSAEPSLNAVREKILAVSALLDKEAEGEQLWQKIELDVIAARQNLINIQDKVKVLFVLSMQSGSPVVSGADTQAAEIIYLAGGVNAARGFSGYKPMPVEAVIAAQPDIILMMDRGGDHGASIEQLKGAGFSLTPAGINQRLVTMDGMKMLGFGPRIADAIRELGQAFYPAEQEINKL